MSVTLELNNHTNTAGVTLEQPVCPGNELCLARDGIRGDCPLLPVRVLHGEKPQGSELGFWGAPNSPPPWNYHSTVHPNAPHCCMCPTSPASATGQSQDGGVTLSPWDTLGRERQAFENSRDFYLNPMGLLIFEDTSEFSHMAPAQQRRTP